MTAFIPPDILPQWLVIALRNRRVQTTCVAVALLLILLSLVTRMPGSASRPTLSHEDHNNPDSGKLSYGPIVDIAGITLGQGSWGLDSEEVKNGSVDALSRVKEELLSRYQHLKASTDHVECQLDISRYESSGLLSSVRSSTSDRVSIALDLYNSEHVLPSLSLALLEVVHTLRPHHELYISIFENDSGDGTLGMLGELAAALLALKVDGLWFRHSQLAKGFAERIHRMADLRNEAILPLLPTAADGILLFINDVVTCGSDVLELAHQLRLQDAHVAISSDWGAVDEFNDTQARLYDSWVARGINGRLPYLWKKPFGYMPISPSENWPLDIWLSQDEAIHNRWLDGRAFPVYSGWNGAVAIHSSLFTKHHLRFRASGRTGWRGGDAAGALGDWGKLLTLPGYLEGDCGESECSLFARDIWNLLDGKARFVQAPQSRTAYKVGDWEAVIDQVPPTKRTGLDASKDELIDWSEVVVPQRVVCVSTYTIGGTYRDHWAEQSEHEELNPMYDPNAKKSGTDP